MYVFQPPTYWGQVKSLTLDGLFAKMHRKNLEMVTSEDGYIAWGSLSVLNVILWQGLSSLQAVTRSMGAPMPTKTLLSYPPVKSVGVETMHWRKEW